MLKIYKKGDRLCLRIHDVKIYWEILDFEERMKIATKDYLKSGDMIEESQYKIFQTMKMAIKDIEGVEYADGSKYELEFDDNNHLTASCVNELLSSNYAPEIVHAATEYLTGKNEGVVRNRATGVDLVGVEFTLPSAKKKTTKRSRASKSRPAK